MYKYPGLLPSLPYRLFFLKSFYQRFPKFSFYILSKRTSYIAYSEFTCNMCKESVSVSSAENKSVFTRLWNTFSLKNATPPKVEKSVTATTTITTTAAATATTANRLSVSGDHSDNNVKLERVFTYFDENGDGKVSPAELRKCVKAVGGELTVEEAEMAVRLSDSDGDGFLGLEDFTKLMEGMEEERNKESELIGAFGMYEMEGTGCITPKSLKRMLSRLGESTSIDNCKAMIRRFDLNGDGVLNFDEFRVMMTS